MPPKTARVSRAFCREGRFPGAGGPAPSIRRSLRPWSFEYGPIRPLRLSYRGRRMRQAKPGEGPRRRAFDV